MKTKAFAPVNVAPIKYWGKEDEKLRIPANSNLSMCLEKLGTETEVEFRDNLKRDEVWIDGREVGGRARERVLRQIERIRRLTDRKEKVKVMSRNNFPKSTGLSSSASGMGALTVAGCKAAGLSLSEKELSRLARLASGSACRSIPDGWVEWVKGSGDKTSYAKQVFPVKHRDLRILVVILSKVEKRISTTKGHGIAKTSPFYKKRMETVRRDLRLIKKYIRERDFQKFGEMLEDESLNMHAVMLTSRPNLIYWLPETVRVMQAVQGWRKQGLESYFTINTGQNVFVVCEAKNEKGLVSRLEKIEGVLEVKRDKVGRGSRLI